MSFGFCVCRPDWDTLHLLCTPRENSIDLLSSWLTLRGVKSHADPLFFWLSLDLKGDSLQKGSFTKQNKQFIIRKWSAANSNANILGLY